MSYHLTSLGSQVILQPERAARTLFALFRRFHGRTIGVAAHLGVSTSTVKRWVALLEEGGHSMRDGIDGARRQRMERDG